MCPCAGKRTMKDTVALLQNSQVNCMDLLPDWKIGGCPTAGNAGNVFPTNDFKGNASKRSRHVRHTRAAMHVGIANPRWLGKCSRHSQRTPSPQYYVFGKRPMQKKITCQISHLHRPEIIHTKIPFYKGRLFEFVINCMETWYLRLTIAYWPHFAHPGVVKYYQILYTN